MIKRNEEANLCQQIKDKNPKAYKDFFENYYEPIKAIICKKINKKIIAEDLTSTVHHVMLHIFDFIQNHIDIEEVKQYKLLNCIWYETLHTTYHCLNQLNHPVYITRSVWRHLKRAGSLYKIEGCEDNDYTLSSQIDNDTNNPEALVILENYNNYLSKKIQELCKSLTKAEHYILNHHYGLSNTKKLSFEEISNNLGLKLTSVYTLHDRAKKKLKTYSELNLCTSQ